jgi:hypothetical protein
MLYRELHTFKSINQGQLNVERILHHLLMCYLLCICYHIGVIAHAQVEMGAFIQQYKWGNTPKREILTPQVGELVV